MKQRIVLLLLILLISILPRCKRADSGQPNPSLETLGHYLFFEKRLSANHSKSCGSCHSPQFAFTDGYRTSVTAYGENLKHNAPGLINIAGNHYYDWANPELKTMQDQIKRPLYNKHPVEMGFDVNNTQLFRFFETDSLYHTLFSRAFYNDPPVFSATHVEESIIAFVRTLRFTNSKYDRYMRGEQTAMNENERKGMHLFNDARLKCNVCHRPPLFTLCNLSDEADSVFINTGLYNTGPNHQYPSGDRGLMEKTRKVNDDGKFKIPSLRNIMLTAPYMHDGSVNTIEEVIDIYARGGRHIRGGLNQGDGAHHKNKHPLIGGFRISAQEKYDLIQFLSALTDTSYLADMRFKDPFRKE